MMEQRIQNLTENVNSENVPPLPFQNSQLAEDAAVARVPDIDTIRCEEEYRFMLLRHATLLEAMTNSTYIASKMKTWSDSGRELLMEILAKVGLPLKDCKQKYTHMPPQMKKLLDEKLPELAEAMQLDELKFASFRRCHGYKTETSAVDVVHAVTALLEQSSEQKQSAMERLSSASRALTSNSELEKGIHLAMRIQRTIIQYGGLSLARGDVHAVPGFFYINLADTTAADAKYLVHYPCYSPPLHLRLAFLSSYNVDLMYLFKIVQILYFYLHTLLELLKLKTSHTNSVVVICKC